MTLIRLLPALLLAIPAAAWSHPHTIVQQQGQLSLARTRAVLAYRIMSSTVDGAHMFDHLDANHDGRLNGGEQADFANALTAHTVLTVDGVRRRLRIVRLTFPDRAAMVRGTGMIEVTARAELSLAPARRHHVALDVTHHQFARRWFLQPFYHPDLARSAPTLRRRAGSAAIDILIGA